VGKQVAHERLERCAQRAERAESEAELARTQLSAMHALLHTNGEAHAEALAAELAHAHAEIARPSARLAAPSERADSSAAPLALRGKAPEATQLCDRSVQTACLPQRQAEEHELQASPA
jgi:hypothetical protein